MTPGFLGRTGNVDANRGGVRWLVVGFAQRLSRLEAHFHHYGHGLVAGSNARFLLLLRSGEKAFAQPFFARLDLALIATLLSMLLILQQSFLLGLLA